MQDVETKFLYDTGATCTIIGIRVWNEIPQEQQPPLFAPDRRLITVDGQHLKVLGKGTLKLTLAGQPVTSVVWVGDIAEPAVIGLDILSEFKCQWDWDHGTLVFPEGNCGRDQESLTTESDPDEGREIGSWEEDHIAFEDDIALKFPWYFTLPDDPEGGISCILQLWEEIPESSPSMPNKKLKPF